MPVDWRREDYGYAGAAIAAGVLVAYLIAGNFGLVPSPVIPATLAAGNGQPSVAAIGPTQSPGSTVGGITVPVATKPTSVPSKPAYTPVPGSLDRTPPQVAITTAPGLAVSVTAPGVVQGTAIDSDSGMYAVKVTFANPSAPSTVTADLACDGAHITCRWSAPIPAIVGTYSVTADGWDREHNDKTAGPITITVVNTGTTISQVADAVGRAPGTLVNVVGAVTNLLGGGKK